MTAYQVIVSDGREIGEIDALLRALARLRHWSAAAAARRPWHDDRGARLHASASRLRDEAWADSLLAAYALFEIDAIHQAWSDGRPSRRTPDGSALAELLAMIGDAEARARRHDRAEGDRERHAALAQQADERAEDARRAARTMIEAAFPGVRWPTIAAAAL